MFELIRELLPHALWAGIGGSSVYGHRRLQQWRLERGQGALFAGLADDALFVFPPRPSVESRRLPRMAIEDFLAINNVQGAYRRVARRPPEKIRDSDSLRSHDRAQHDLILLGGSSNPATAEAIHLLRSRNAQLGLSIPYFDTSPAFLDQSEKRIAIRWNRAVYESPSYVQAGPRYEDVAMIVKAQSPWSSQRKILVIAGIRGIGTWGAAEYLKKWWFDLYRRKDRSRRRRTTKQGDFAALVNVVFEEQDVKSATLLNVMDLEPAYSE